MWAVQQQFPVPSQFRSPRPRLNSKESTGQILRGATYYRAENGYKGDKYYDSPSASATDNHAFHDGTNFVTRSTNNNIKNANALLKDAEDVLVNEMNNLVPAPGAHNMTKDKQHMALDGNSTLMKQARQAATQLSMVREANAAREHNGNATGLDAAVHAR